MKRVCVEEKKEKIENDVTLFKRSKKMNDKSTERNKEKKSEKKKKVKI